MTLMCKESKQIWDNDRAALKELDTMQTRIRTEKLEKLYLEHYGQTIKFDEELKLTLDIRNNNDLKFMEEASKLRFNDFSELEIYL